MSIEVQSVSKYYKTQCVLDEISFTAETGEIIGFLGPNGAGKTSMMQILTGYTVPDSGAVFVAGIDVLKNPIEAKSMIGYLPEQNPLYKEMYVEEYLRFRAAVFKLQKQDFEEVIHTVGLNRERYKRMGQLSKGYQQRVGLAAAILHNPQVLILDEPNTGLDPIQLQEMRTLIKKLGKNKTILFSTHIIQEVEAVCDRILIVNKGRLLFDKSMKDLKKKSRQTIEVTFDYQLEGEFIKKLPSLVTFGNTFDRTWLLVFESKNDVRPIIFDFAKQNGLEILELTLKNQDLEDLFNELTVP